MGGWRSWCGSRAVPHSLSGWNLRGTASMDLSRLRSTSTENLQRVGINRPDLHFDHGGRRYHVEYDSPTSGRGLRHQSRITSNDTDVEVILLIVP